MVFNLAVHAATTWTDQFWNQIDALILRGECGLLCRQTYGKRGGRGEGGSPVRTGRMPDILNRADT